ncbi:MAG: cell wall hydrolase [Lachnospiraceae bacterium]|nr:cell wall hydrolase [Lachnospiraceae bacterium]
MRKAAKGALAVVAALSATLVPAASNASVAMAPAPVKDASSQKVIILQSENHVVENVNNYNRIKRLSDNHEKRAQIQEAARIKRCCGVSVSASDRIILERIVEAEAGGEDHKGKVLVANVVLNRVKSKSFPSTIREVVFAHRGSTYQFSPIYDGRYYTVNVSDDTKKAVSDALNGVDPSQGALYFMERAYADSDNAAWFDRCLTRLFGYHCHEFYK